MQNNVGIYASQISGHLWAPNGAYDALATVTVPSGGAASITFAGIPTGYKHLQIRAIARGSDAGSSRMEMRFNGDTGSNYSYHYVYGDGSAAYGGGAGSDSSIYLNRIAGSGTTASVFGAEVLDILDYADINKYKTLRAITAFDANGSGEVHLNSGSWRNTSAISSISITAEGAAGFAQYTQFALYGVK